MLLAGKMILEEEMRTFSENKAERRHDQRVIADGFVSLDDNEILPDRSQSADLASPHPLPFLSHCTLARMAAVLVVLIVCVVTALLVNNATDSRDKDRDIVRVGEWTRYVLAPQTGAVCNDGSFASFWVRQGTGGGDSDVSGGDDDGDILVYLQGGFSCTDEATCADRWRSRPWLMSSTADDGVTIATKLEYISDLGIFSRDATRNPALAQATHVFVPYCSSDSWIGDTAVTDDIPWQFRGRRIVDAVIAALFLDEDLDPSSPVLPSLSSIGTLVFGGCSAGGRGSLYSIDRVCDAVLNSSSSVSVRRCVGFHDAAWWVDQFGPLDQSGGIQPLNVVASRGYVAWNGTVDASCASTHAQNPSLCMFARHLLPEVHTPVFVHEEAYDSFQLRYLVGDWSATAASIAADPTSRAFAENFANQVRFEMFGLPPLLGKRFWMGSCFKHCMSEAADFYSIAPAGDQSLAYALHSWLTDGDHSSVQSLCADGIEACNNLC